MTEKENRSRNINFRTTEKLYEDMMNYLKGTGESISVLMRHITFDYLKFKKAVQEVESNDK